MADIPGIIEGASEGKGLGFAIFTTYSSVTLIWFLVPADSDDIAKEYEILRNELAVYNPELVDKQHILAISKWYAWWGTDGANARWVTTGRLPLCLLFVGIWYGIDRAEDILWKR